MPNKTTPKDNVAAFRASMDYISNHDGLQPERGGKMEELQNFLADAEMMIRNEVQYVRTGKHPGVPMRDCVGQWQSLANDAKRLLNELHKAG